MVSLWLPSDPEPMSQQIATLASPRGRLLVLTSFGKAPKLEGENKHIPRIKAPFRNMTLKLFFFSGILGLFQVLSFLINVYPFLVSCPNQPFPGFLGDLKHLGK